MGADIPTDMPQDPAQMGGAEQQLTPAQTIDLEDGKFFVNRSSGEVEQGWEVTHVGDVTLPDGTVVQAAEIAKIGDEKGAYRQETVETLRSWQPTEDEPQAAPESKLKGSLAKPAASNPFSVPESTSSDDDEVTPAPETAEATTPQEGLIEEVAEDIGEEAVEAAKVIVEGEPGSEPEAAPAAPDLKDILATPEAFEAAMNDPEGNEDLRRSLKSLNREWQQARIAGVTEKVWTEMIVPRLQKVVGVAPQLVTVTTNAHQVVGEIAQGLDLLGTAVANRRDEEANSVMHRYNFDGLRYQATSLLGSIAGDGNLKTARQSLNLEEMNGNEDVQRARAEANAAQVSEEMITDLRALSDQGLDMAAIRTQLSDRIAAAGGKDWRQHQRVIQEVVDLARITTSDSVEAASKSLAEHYDLFVTTSLNRDRLNINDEELLDLTARAKHLMSDLEKIRRFALMAKDFADQATKR